MNEITTVPAWGEYAMPQVPQPFTPIAGKNTSYGITGLSTLASNSAGAEVLALNAQTGEVTLQRSGRFVICGALYVAGALRKANPNATIDVMGALFIEIPPTPSPDPGVKTHTVRLGQTVVRLSALGELPYSGFSFAECTALMLPMGTKISLRVGIFADNLSTGQFVGWQARVDAAAGGANLSIHELPGGVEGA
ncbi:MAG: hypothetical protein ACAF41_17980 [Leptolyngbya sp. BL-A-14]